MAINQLPELTTVPVFVVLYEDERDMVHTAANGYRCKDYSCPCADAEGASMEQDPEDDMEARLSRQAAQHIEDRNYFSMWGLHDRV